MDKVSWRKFVVKLKNFSSYKGDVYNYVISRIRVALRCKFGDRFSDDELEEFTHEIFLKLYEPDNVVDVDGIANAESYLAKVAENFVLDYLRKTNRVQYAADVDRYPVLTADMANVLRNSQAIAMFSKLDKLTADCIILSCVYGYKSHEISEMLGIKATTVRSRVYRGIKFIQKYCNKNHFDFV